MDCGESLGQVNRFSEELDQAIIQNRPLPVGCSSLILKMRSQDLFYVMGNHQLHDRVHHPAPDLIVAGRRMNYHGEGSLSLSKSVYNKWRGGSVRPATGRILTAIRLFFHMLISELGEEAQLRIKQVFQVSMCPGLITRQMAKYTALTYTHNNSACLPEHFVPIFEPSVHWLSFHSMPSKRYERLVPFYETGMMKIDPVSLQGRVERMTTNPPNLSLIYGPGMPMTDDAHLNYQGAGILTALALHEALEMAVVSGTGGGTPGPFATKVQDYLPTFWLGREMSEPIFEVDVDRETSEVSSVLLESFIEKMDWLVTPNEGGDERSLVWEEVLSGTRAAGDGDNRFDWMHAVKHVKDKLPKEPQGEFRGYMDALGDDFFKVLEAVWFSDVVRMGKMRLLPVDYFLPGSPQDPVRSAKGRLWCQFSPKHTGRACYDNGILAQEKLASVHVFRLEDADTDD